MPYAKGANGLAKCDSPLRDARATGQLTQIPETSLVSTEDKMIPPDAQRAMSKRAGSTVVEAKGSHAIYVSQPRAVADLIAKAANGVALATR
jgi:pimeloyl-ACP methyl ester carboxylesterase